MSSGKKSTINIANPHHIMRSWFILFLTVTTVSAGAFTSRADLDTAISKCLAVDSTGKVCCAGAGVCGAAGTDEMKDWTFTSAITDMSNLFQDQSDFNAPIGAWDTSKVTTMASMFSRATAFNQSLTFDTKQVTYMNHMFYGATAFNQPLTFDTSQVRDMRGMFYGASAFNQPLTFNTYQVTARHSMFSDATSFNQPHQGEYWGFLPCPAGKLRVSNGAECTVPEPACPVNMYRTTVGGDCIDVPEPACPVNMYRQVSFLACMDVPVTCAQLKAEYQSSSRGCKCSSRTSLF